MLKSVQKFPTNLSHLFEKLDSSFIEIRNANNELDLMKFMKFSSHGSSLDKYVKYPEKVDLVTAYFADNILLHTVAYR